MSTVPPSVGAVWCHRGVTLRETVTAVAAGIAGGAAALVVLWRLEWRRLGVHR